MSPWVELEAHYRVVDIDASYCTVDYAITLLGTNLMIAEAYDIDFVDLERGWTPIEHVMEFR